MIKMGQKFVGTRNVRKEREVNKEYKQWNGEKGKGRNMSQPGRNTEIIQKVDTKKKELEGEKIELKQMRRQESLLMK